MTTENLTPMPVVDEAKMKRAFELVQPATHWKDPINAYVKVEDMERAGVEITDIRDAVEFYTATEATFARNGAGYTVKAAGYYAGPAGP
jgi:hypothetical protein